ncbi:MAG: aromatic hydrocarbon degradation protein [Prevotellaceae bacterium]|jgi:long-chain fatty acid transport protein|nr:aromatic hydrocarbon degradation protein [Prevotellaceae bacterium]
MKRIFFVVAITFCTLRVAWAGGFLTNTNQNVHFLRNPARGASTGIDAAYTNPAGLAFLKGDGFFFSLNNQSAFQTRTITADFAPFAGFGGNSTKEFEGEASAWVIPNLQAAYKTGNWAFSANIGVTGGGGSLDFSSGLPSFESTLAIVPAFLKQMQPVFGGYSLESRLEGSSVTYGVQAGATYTIGKHFSTYVGVRYHYANNGYNGYLKNIQLGLGGNMLPAQTVIAPVIEQFPQYAGLALLVAEKNLDCKQSGAGIAPIIGLNYNWNKLNIGAKYEFKTNLDLKNKTIGNTTGLADFNDGVVTPYDIPALLTVGAQYDILPKLNVSVSYHHFFDSDAEMANDKQKFLNGGVNEYLAGVEYKINDLFLVSCGAQITRTSATDNYQSDLNFALNSYSFGLGGAISISKNIRLNLAYLFTNYENWTKKSDDYGKINSLTGGSLSKTAGTDIFGRTNQTFGIGLDFHF